MNLTYWGSGRNGELGYYLFWLGDLYWILIMVGSMSFMGALGGYWAEKLSSSVLTQMVRVGVNKLLAFVYGRDPLVFGGFKKMWEVWALVYFSLVLSEVLPFSTQVTYLGYPLAVLVVSGMLSLWTSSFFFSPVKFIGGLVPSGVPVGGAPFVMVLVLISGWLRPLVLVMRLSMAAIMMVTLEGIFHFQYTQLGDSFISSSLFSVYHENLGLFSIFFLVISGVLGLEKLFYMSFQVFLLCSLLLVYQSEHVIQGPDILGLLSPKSSSSPTVSPVNLENVGSPHYWWQEM